MMNVLSSRSKAIGSLALICMFIPIALAEEKPTGSAMEIMEAGIHHGDEITAQSGETWWGLYPKGDGFELLPATITVEAIREYDNPPGMMTGKEVSVNDKRQPLILVKGLKNPSSGLIKTLFHGYRFLYPGQSEHFTIDKKIHVTICTFGTARPSEKNTWPPRVVDYSLCFSLGQQGSPLQEILKLPAVDEDGPPTLRWVGDLDRDGKPDFLMDLTHHYNLKVMTLFLSSEASNGQLAAKVAERRSTGC